MKMSRRARLQGDVLGAVLHTNLTLIEVADPLLLEELRADRQLGPLLVAQLSDRVAVVKPGGGEWVMRALLKAGHTPKVINP
jgi:hypothetical protein